MSEVMRMSFVLMREDIPALFDDLQHFPKGPRRINRLRILAYAGLTAMDVQSRHPESERLLSAATPNAAAGDPLGDASLEFFGPPLR
ncbi:hypothetical protein [Janthinobacterium lividum]|uniref:hypothetical protein n=1 Tax=Janthinobacterium lividum TaxID=29581 RepID=UPI0008FCDE3D|nr:hypothetical protein [Janthinobacterium lividum]MCC7716657.1 hypothetical protein [Janthinobacterium lividum]WQE31999.1 hypothetical protein U0004_29330 [Janthinobacterium lividum]